jgi:hypothetical protein
VCRRVHHPLQAVQDDARHRVHHRGERRDRDHVARRLDRAFLGVALDLLQALGIGGRADVAQLLENRERVVLEQRRELGVAIPRAEARRFVDVQRFAAERRHECRAVLQLDVALARLLGVVERIRVEERPDELPRDVLEAELEMCVLVDGVMPASKVSAPIVSRCLSVISPAPMTRGE